MGFFHQNWDGHDRQQAPLIEILPDRRGRLPDKHQPKPQLKAIIRRGPFALVWVNPNPPGQTGSGSRR
jgi:hypothetical protein